MDIPNVGYGLLQEFIDFKTKTISLHIPHINWCERYEIPFDFNLNEYFDNLLNLNPKYVQYLGEQTPSFDQSNSFYTFYTTAPVKGPMIKDLTQIFYFDKETRDITYSFQIYKNIVVKMEEQKPSEFEDSDFELPDICKAAQIKSDSAEAKKLML